MMPTLPLVGDELAGYRLRAVLNRGGMAVVYEAENPRLGSLVALKVLAPELAADDVFRARFMNESRIAATLNHPNVIPIYDVGAAGDLLYLAMRYVVGSDLRALLKVQHQLPPAGRCRCSARWPGHSTPRTAAGWCTGTSSRATS